MRFWRTPSDADKSSPAGRPGSGDGDGGVPLEVLEGIQSRLSALEDRLADLDTADGTARIARAFAGDALDKCEALNDRLNAITLAVAEGIQHVDRAEKRIQATVQRARRELREAGIDSPGVEAEASQLHLVDGDGSDERGVHALRADMEAAQPARHDVLRERLRQMKLSS